MNYRIQRLPKELPDEWETLLSAQRREQVLRLRSIQRRKESVAAYLLLSEMLGVQAPELSILPNGKPYLRDFPETHFNFSHCASHVACALSVKPIGIDIERIRPYKQMLARKVLSDEELLQVETSANPAREFIRFWTKKEALLKLTGEGIRSDLKTVLQNSAAKFTVQEAEDYICTIAE